MFVVLRDGYLMSPMSGLLSAVVIFELGKIQLMRSLGTFIFLYACELWTLTAELQRRIQAMEMRCYCRRLHISYKDHVSNEEVYAKTQ